ncbi:MAG: thioredoxin family protein [Candidatus Thermoplasmatota archaeon]|nr:thioredoxin family protein [Candidatus Thermoplasmatota archaeon]
MIEDITEISERGVMVTPALAIDSETKAKGEVLDPEKIKELLK